MSKNTKGFMGDQIGKLGPAVGRRWKDLMVYSAYQKNVHNPNTRRQQVTRAAMRTLGKLGHAFLKVLRVGYKYAASRSTEVGEFIKSNFAAVTVNVSTGAVTINYDELMVAKGNKTNPVFGTPDYSTAGKIVVPITDGMVDEDNPQNDMVMLLAYNPTFGKIAVSNDNETRGSSEVQVKYPAAWTGTEVQLYAYVRADVDASKPFACSDSLWLGSGTCA